MSTLPSMAPRGPKPHRRVCRGLAYCDWCEAWAAGRFDGPPRHRAPKHAQIYLVSRDLRPRVSAGAHIWCITADGVDIGPSVSEGDR